MPLRNLPESDMACSKAFATHSDTAKRTGEEVKNALGGTDGSGLTVTFRRAVSLSTPPPTLYHNYRSGGYSKLIFGVPLVDLGTSEGKVPKVMRICIEEIEKRGLNVNQIYTVSLLVFEPCFRIHAKFPSRIPHVTQQYEAQQQYGRLVECTVLTNLITETNFIQLLHRFEIELSSFSFTYTDDIHSVAALLKVSYCNHCKHVDSLSLFLALPLRSSRATVSALLERI